jgi:nicotinamide phosphoribosyltransferase
MTCPLTQADFYKVSHKKFEKNGTTKIYANFTPRSGKYAKWYDGTGEARKVVVVGIQMFIKDFLMRTFNKEFFYVRKQLAVGKFKRRCETALGKDAVDMAHIEALWDLGYLPLSIKALPEGAKVGFKVPVLTVTNTDERFSWLVTYLETVMSQELWGPMTSATTAYQFLKLCNKYADLTVGNRLHVPFQCHDFSARGMFGRNAGAMSGVGHLLSFVGTDTIAAIDAVEEFYNVNAENYLIGTSVPASEHSVTSLGIAVDGELETIRRWITKDYPTGIVSVVSDTLDYWRVLTEYLPILKDEILARKPNELGLSKVVVRPDSGDPVKIICGYNVLVGIDTTSVAAVEDAYYEDYEAVQDLNTGKFYMFKPTFYHDDTLRSVGLKEITKAEALGSIQLLWETFGGKINALGYKELDPHIGLIYGDSITLERAEEIFERLKDNGFASSNVVFGVGSFTYQMVSRDTLGFAMKATAAVVDGKLLELYKDPVTDDGTKRSARGYLRVEKVNGEYVLFDQQSEEQEEMGELVEVFFNGSLLVEYTFEEMRARLLSE